MLLLPHGHGHVISDEPAKPAVEIGSIVGEHFDRDESMLDYGGDGQATRLVGGLFHFEEASMAAITAALPEVVHIASDQGKTPDWLNALSPLAKESHEAEAGSSLMISRLIDLLVIRTLRTCAATQVGPESWVGALKDERISRVLNVIHANPYRNWTLREIEAGSMGVTGKSARKTLRPEVAKCSSDCTIRWM
jgi:Cupin